MVCLSLDLVFLEFASRLLKKSCLICAVMENEERKSSSRQHGLQLTRLFILIRVRKQHMVKNANFAHFFTFGPVGGHFHMAFGLVCGHFHMVPGHFGPVYGHFHVVPG